MGKGYHNVRQVLYCGRCDAYSGLNPARKTQFREDHNKGTGKHPPSGFKRIQATHLERLTARKPVELEKRCGWFRIIDYNKMETLRVDCYLKDEHKGKHEGILKWSI